MTPAQTHKTVKAIAIRRVREGVRDKDLRIKLLAIKLETNPQVVDEEYRRKTFEAGRLNLCERLYQFYYGGSSYYALKSARLRKPTEMLIHKLTTT